jgi:hypothetical protein
MGALPHHMTPSAVPLSPSRFSGLFRPQSSLGVRPLKIIDYIFIWAAYPADTAWKNT